MKKAILNGMTVLFAILLFSSCDALIEDALQDRDKTALETERDTYVTPDESTEEPTDPSTEIPTDELTEVSTEAPTEEPTESVPDETLPSLLDSFTLEENPKMFMLIVELEGADGCDMEQLTYRMAHKDGKTYSYTATLNHRVYQPGDTIENSFRDLVYQGKAVDIQEAIKSGLLKVSLSDYCMVGSPEENAFTWTEDGRAVLTVTQDMAPDTDGIPGYVYSVTVYVGEEAWFFSGIIIY